MSSTALALVSPAADAPVPVDHRLLRLKQMVLDSVVADNSKRNYAKALDHLFSFASGRAVTRELMLAWRASMENQSPSTVNIRLSAMRSLVAEARRAGMISSEDAAKLTDIPNIKQAGARKGNWLTREQAKEILAVPDRSKLKGKRDYVILSLLVACALRRTELAELDVATIQQREGRWVLADLEGKGREDASARLRFRSGSSRESTPGRQPRTSREAGSCVPSGKAAR